jgi:hypothetical protein
LFVRNGRYGLYHNDKGIIFEPVYRVFPHLPKNCRIHQLPHKSAAK